MTLVAKITMKRGWDSTEGLERGLAEMATDIHSRASVLAPKKDRHLVNSGKIARIGAMAYKISFGSSQVPYARIHELGGWTGRGYSTYITPKKYLTTAAEGVARSDKSKYFKGKVGV